MASENKTSGKDNEITPEIRALVDAMVADALGWDTKKRDGEREALAARKQRERERMSEKVTVRLFKDGRDYRDDVYVAVNGENRVIRRGVPVELERRFAEVLKQSNRQDLVAAAYNEQKQNEYKEESARRGI